MLIQTRRPTSNPSDAWTCPTPVMSYTTSDGTPAARRCAPTRPIRTPSATTATTKSMRFISATAFALATPQGLLLLREPYRVPLSWRGKKHGWDPILVPKRKILPSLYGPPYMGSSAPCSPDFLEEFFSETEHIVIRCGESSRRRAGSRRIGHEGSRPFAMPRRSRLATCRPLVKP